MFTTIIIFIAVLSLLVFVHEFGHFWTARKFGLKPDEFGFGMPPRAFGIYKNKEKKWKKVIGSKKVDDASDTIYSINWLPLGGFVKLGEDDTNIPKDANHFNNKKIWQKTVILLAGVTMNIVLAAVLISFGFMIGLPQVINEDIQKNSNISNRQIQIVSVLDNSPASEAKIEIGDIILSVNNVEIKSTEELQKYTSDKTGEDIVYTLKRKGEIIKKQITPKIIKETQTGGIGIGIAETGIVRYPIHIAIWEGIKTTIFLTWMIILAFYDLIAGLIMGKGISVELGGPVRIAEITGDAARMGFAYLINFTAILSINLAIINALPLPALDGGRVLFLLIEKIKGSPVKKEVEGVIHYVGFALLMILVLIVTYKDIARIFTN